MQIVEALRAAIRRAATYNADAQAQPACVLWPDGDREWESVVTRIRQEMPELLILGSYDGAHSGPAIWLRCLVAGTIQPTPVPEGSIPVVYLPGVSRTDLRSLERCPSHLKPIAPLQFSGSVWSQSNGKDWTVFAFLKSRDGGLGIDLAQDATTKEALHRALALVLEEDVQALAGKRLDKEFFNGLLEGDPDRDLLRWLNAGEDFRQARTADEWQVFVDVCRDRFDFDPERDGAIEGAARLASHPGPWQKPWARFREAPGLYPKLPDRIRQANPPSDMFADKSGWPQCNDEQEGALRGELLALVNVPSHQARIRIAELDATHGMRRGWVWAAIGQAPLACALEHLVILARGTEHPLGGDTPEAFAQAYRSSAWQADGALLRALACARSQKDTDAVGAAVRSLYPDWANDTALSLQRIVERRGYPASPTEYAVQAGAHAGESFVFVDGLRLDLARRLRALLEDHGCVVGETDRWAALPTITATGKPAISPVHGAIGGEAGTLDFEPIVSESGQSLRGNQQFRRLLEVDRWQVLAAAETGDPAGRAWTECGNIDQEGHEHGSKLGPRVEGLLREVCERVTGLLAAGWRSVRIVTDHGWVLLPGGLPKTDLPATLTEAKWGRFALVKEGAPAGSIFCTWHWNSDQRFVVAPGISCYRAGVEFTHGGLSPQECITLELQVSLGAGVAVERVKIVHVGWKAMRCTVATTGPVGGCVLDIRLKPGDAKTSVLLAPSPVRDDGTASVAVLKDQYEGTKATVVILRLEAELLAQCDTTIGGAEA